MDQSNLIANIPIMLVLSLNTSAEAIHSLLPRTSVFRLKMTPFAVDMGGGAVTSLIQQVGNSALTRENMEIKCDLTPFRPDCV